MTTAYFASRLAICVAALAAVNAQAQTLPNRILVSAKTGVDNAGCGGPTAPCRTFQYAHDNVVAGGEVQVMDPGDYQPVHITKSISIVNDGAGPAGVLDLPFTGAAIAIDAGASDRVALRGLDLEGHDNGRYGVQLNVAGSLNIAKCVMRGFRNSGAGIYVAPTSATAFSITDTIVSNNNQGIRVFPQMTLQGTGQANGVIEGVTATNNSYGVEIIGPATTVTISRSVISNNDVWGMLVQNQAGYGIVSAREVVASNNGPGSGDSYTGSGFITTGGLLRLAHSVATGNQYGVTLNGGLVESYGDNDLRGNVGASVNTITGSFTSVANR